MDILEFKVMLSKEHFIKAMQINLQINNFVDKLSELNIDIIESDIFTNIGLLFDTFVESHFNDEGQDLVFWWMYEDVPKILYVDGEAIQVENVEDFWNFLTAGPYFK